MVALQLLKAFHFARRSGLADFWQWWRGELVALVPTAPRTAIARRRMRPVVVFAQGLRAQEWIEHGKSGFLVKDIEEALAAVEAVGSVSRAGVRAAFEERFTADRMARDYVALYERLIGADKPAMFQRTLTRVA